MTTAGARRRNRRGEGSQLRVEIVRAAAELLDEGGTERDVTLRAVAKRIGIAAPSIYTHFPDVGAILLAVTQEAFAELGRALRDVPGDADPVQHLRAVCAAYLAFAQRWPRRYRVMFGGVWDASEAAARTPDLAPGATALGLDVFELLVDAVRACAAVGRSTSTDPAGDTTARWVGLHGLAGLRTAAPLFPWPATVERDLVDRLALLRPE